MSGECVESPPENRYGFVYLITVKQSPTIPSELWGKIYVGKKAFTHRKKSSLSKKQKLLTGKRVVVKRVDSGWLNYYGSSKQLTEDVKRYGKENFKREILTFCDNKAHLSYCEVYYQVKLEVLFNPSYNGWINCKIFKNQLLCGCR